jgi:hypothetical protein
LSRILPSTNDRYQAVVDGVGHFGDNRRRSSFGTREMRSRHHSRNKLLDDLKRLGMRPRRGHDLRRTFITLARVDGARSDLLQMVTHNPSNNIIDIYASMPWPSLCAEVAKLNVQRRKGEFVVLPKAVNGEQDEPQGAMLDGKGPESGSQLTSVFPSAQNATRPEPRSSGMSGRY